MTGVFAENTEIGNDIEESLKIIKSVLSLEVDKTKLIEYLSGYNLGLLNYEGLDNVSKNITALERYLIGANAYLELQKNFHNVVDPDRIARMSRIVILLGHVLRSSVLNCKGSDDIIKRLKSAKTYEDFDSTFFEILVGFRYFEKYGNVEFLKTSSSKMPDMKVHIGTKEFFIECKKQKRINQASIDLRNSIRDLLSKVCLKLIQMKNSLSVEVTFKKEPSVFSVEDILDKVLEAKEKGCFADESIEVRVNVLKEIPADEFPFLYAFPKFIFERYGYRYKGPWMGLINLGESQPVGVIGTDLSKLQFTSWTAGLRNDNGIKWKITDKSYLYKIKRLSASTTFSAFDQLKGRGPNTVVHYWIETDVSNGSKTDEFLEYKDRMENSKDAASRIVINETICDCTPREIRFDFIENAHYLAKDEPLVLNVFADSEFENGPGFGIGAALPDLEDHLD